MLPGEKQEPLNLVLGKYPIDVLSVKVETYKDKKGVWWVQTSKGYKVLKKVSSSESTLRFTLAAINHLTANGINIPRVASTSDGSSYVCIDGTCYILLEAIDGRSPSYTSSEELAAIVRTLAGFHKASEGFDPPADTNPKNHLGTWVEEYGKQLDDMVSFYHKELGSNNRNAVGEFVVKEFPYFEQRALKTIEELKSGDYGKWVEKAAQKGSLCHQDFAAGNLLLDGKGKLHVLDTDSITFDIPARDIRKLLNKVMKKKGSWSAELARKIFAHYQSVNPLTPPEWNVVRLDIMYPHLFLGAMNKYYYQRDSWWTEEKYLKRLKEMSAVEKTAAPVLDSFDTLIPGASAGSIR